MRIRSTLLQIGMAIVIAAGVVTAQDRTVVEWVRANAIPLTTVEAGNGFADLQRLKTIVGDARIVALGEATHGSREIFQIKHRLLEFLASEMGFTIFSIEANLPEAYRLNEYVLHGAGDPAQLLRGLYFWTWDTEEVLDMIRWMRAFNESGKGHIEFTGFDMQTPTVAADIVRRFLTTYEPALSGTATVPLQNAFGVATGTFPLPAAAGKKIRYTGYIKTQGMTRGWAGLWWRVDGPSGTLAFDNMQGRGATGTSDWARFSIELPVGANATYINFGVLQTGDGTAWFDDLAVEIDGEPYTNDAAFDFGFESSTPKGLRTGGTGYAWTLDSTVAHGGTQSLQLRYDAPAPSANAAAWHRILDRLESGREQFQQHGASVHDIEWAAQNARVVLQWLDLQAAASPLVRDGSMATNVKWIADQNPGSKIVLWAHNGHVAAGGGLGGQTMGTYLRTMFGKDMVVIGSAFDQGAFQAMPFPGEPGTLRNVTVPPAPVDTLDATLAAAQIPIFAIDLRRAPAWFADEHRSREIGCCYPNSNPPDALIGPIRAADVFDAMIFVNTVHAARPNPRR